MNLGTLLLSLPERSAAFRLGDLMPRGQPTFRSLPMWDGTSSSAHLLIWWQETLPDRKAPPVMRAAQLFVSFCANNAVIGDAHECCNIGIALTNYASMATAEAGRPFLRAKLDDAPAFFNATETAFDDSAKAVFAARARSIA